MKVSEIASDSATPWTAAYQAPPSMGFARQGYWSGVPLPSPFALTGSDSANKSKEQVRSQPVRAKDWLEFSQLEKCSG